MVMSLVKNWSGVQRQRVAILALAVTLMTALGVPKRRR
jgi:hypothetical protein